MVGAPARRARRPKCQYGGPTRHAEAGIPKVALIQDGTEVGRQWFGDVVGHLQRCCDRLSDGRFVHVSLHVFTDDDLAFLLDGLSREEWQCLVFASNSLNSGRIEQELHAGRADLAAFIASGGGVVVLHQVRPSLAPVLPPGIEPGIHPRTCPRGEAKTVAPDPDDVLLHFPQTVDWSSLGDLPGAEVAGADGVARPVELPSLYFMALGPALPANLKAVMTVGGDIVMARTADHLTERIVVSTLPLDWQERRKGQGDVLSNLLTNAIRFATAGVPQRLIWKEPGTTSNELLMRWLTLDGATAIRPAPQGEIDATDRWLLSKVDVLALAPERIESAAWRAEFSAFLANGGVVLTTSPDAELPASRVVGLVGRYQQRTLAGQLTGELRAVEGWQNIDSAFDIRNIVSAVSFMWNEGVSRLDEARIDPHGLEQLDVLIGERLLDERHREDLGSSIALAQTLAYLRAPESVPAELVDWMETASRGRPFPVELHVRAVLAVARRVPDPTFVSDATAAMAAASAGLASAASVVRLLEAVAVLDQAKLLEAAEAEAAALGAMACEALDRFEVPERGWISVEATAHITLGLAALYRIVHTRGEQRTQLAAHVATGAAALNRARGSYARTPKGVAWLARLVHALIVVDQSFPLGLQRFATLPWPDQPGLVTASRLQRELTQHLALTNERLRDERRQLEERLAATEQAVAEERLAARLGRATATLVPAGVLLLAAWAVVVAIGWKSVNGLVANLTVLTSVLLTVAAFVFSVLARRHLLAAPADRLREWVATKGLPAATSLGKLKRQ